MKELKDQLAVLASAASGGKGSGKTKDGKGSNGKANGKAKVDKTFIKYDAGAAH